MFPRRYILLAPLLAAPLLTAPLRGQDTTRRQQGVFLSGAYTGQRPGVAVLPVSGPLGDSVRAILQRDLDYGDRVQIIGQNAADLPLVSGPPNYDLFAQLNVATIVQASITPNGELHVAVYQVSTKAVLQARNFPLSGTALSPDWRMDLHRASDEVEAWVSGVKGIAATRIAFVRDGRIWMVDSDGAGAAPVEGIGGGLSPSWHPSGRYLAYSTLAGVSDAGGISVRDLWNGTTRRITQTVQSGTFSTPVFLPDGESLAYTWGIDWSDIMVVDAFKGGTSKKVTAGRATNSMPTFSPDGRRMAFTSGRIGNPDVYIADADGSNASLLTNEGFGGKTERTNPSWSPDNRAIAYQTMIDGRFQIAAISPSGRNGVSLTGDSSNEDPFWAPDGRHIAFTSNRSGSTQLWVLDTESARVRQLTRGSKAKNAAWSPPLPRR